MKADDIKIANRSGRKLPCILAPFIAWLLTALLLILTIESSQADSATWALNPFNSEWGSAPNWVPVTVPNGPQDTATFDRSNTREVEITPVIEVNGIVFTELANENPFTIRPFNLLTISGVGITNNSGITQNLLTELFDGYSGVIQFTNSARAGDLTVFTNNDGRTAFFGTSSAGSGTFINNATGSST